MHKCNNSSYGLFKTILIKRCFWGKFAGEDCDNKYQISDLEKSYYIHIN